MVHRIVLSGAKAEGRVALVDDEDAGLVAGYSWCWDGKYPIAHVPGSGRPGKMIRLHTLITSWCGVDHEDLDRLNNTRKNLRKADQSLNMANGPKRRGGSSQFKGVYWHAKDSVWMARIQVLRRQRYLGSFTDEVAAARAYDAAAEEAFGSYARTNVDLGLLPPLSYPGYASRVRLLNVCGPAWEPDSKSQESHGNPRSVDTITALQ